MMRAGSCAPKLLFIINSLEGGGAERVMCTLASALADTDSLWSVTLVTLDDAEDKYPLSPHVMRTRLGSKKWLCSSTGALFRMMIRERPDVVISFLTRANCVAVACSRPLRIPCIISERVHTTSHFASGRFGELQRMAVRRLYPHADRVIAVSKGVGQELVRSYGLQAKQIATIYNPVEIATIENAARELPSIALPPEYVVAMGRLVPNKNFSMLLRSYADAKIAIPLVILGEGPERSRLASLAGELGIADRVVMPGFVSNPHAIVARSSFYVSSSDAEGFPNAMLEAMCVGRPVIATDCDSGPAEILQDGSHTHKVSELTRAKYGILVPARNVHAMSDALRSMGDPETHAHFSAAARHRAREFNLEAALERYKAVIASVVPGPARHLSSTIRYH